MKRDLGSRFMCLALIAATTIAVCVPNVSSARGFNLFDNAQFCSTFLARFGDRSLAPAWKYSCLIAIATTYVDGEANFIPPEEMLLADDVIRYTVGRPVPARDPGNAEVIRAGIRRGDTSIIADWGNPRFTVDTSTNDVFMIWDGYFVGYPDAPAFYVTERFAIRGGLISEVLIGGVQFAPGCGYGIGCTPQ